MLSFSTILFLNGEPIGYRVTREETGCRFQPSEGVAHPFETPAFRLEQEGGEWLTGAEIGEELFRQAVAEIQLHERNGLPSHPLSAAP